MAGRAPATALTPSGAGAGDEDLGIRFGGLQAVEDVNVRLTNNEIVAHRPQRRGQDHGVQPLDRRLRAHGGTGAAPGQAHLRQATYEITNDGIAGRFQNIRLVQVHDGHREHQGGQPEPHVLHHTGHAPCATPTTTVRRTGCDRRAREHLRVFDMEHLAEQNANTLPYGQQRSWRSAGHGLTTRRCFCWMSRAAGMNPIETEELMQDHPPHPRAVLGDDPPDRARYEAGHGHLRAHLRAQLRPRDRRGHAHRNQEQPRGHPAPTWAAAPVRSRRSERDMLKVKELNVY